MVMVNDDDPDDDDPCDDYDDPDGGHDGGHDGDDDRNHYLVIPLDLIFLTNPPYASFRWGCSRYYGSTWGYSRYYGSTTSIWTGV